MVSRSRARLCALAVSVAAVAGCQNGFRGFDLDLRDPSEGLDTSQAALAARAVDRPRPDDRGVISYPDYQVAVARQGDTAAEIAARVGLPAEEVARFNGLPPDAPLRAGEIVALPRRVAEPSSATGAITTGPIRPAGQIDVTTIAGAAIDRADTAGPAPQAGAQPARHRVAPGETAFSVARRYGVSVDALADWNALGPERTVRVGQFLLIPPATKAPPAGIAEPGEGTVAPVPPSADEPLPPDDTAAPTEIPVAPDLAREATAASDTARLVTPVPGSIVRGYSKGSNEGIDIAAPAGSPVRAADEGTVAAITRDTDGVPIIVVRHEGNLLTVYAGVEDLKVEKGARVSRGQTIAAVRSGEPAVLHFEVRDGFESVDPSPYLN